MSDYTISLPDSGNERTSTSNTFSVTAASCRYCNGPEHEVTACKRVKSITLRKDGTIKRIIMRPPPRPGNQWYSSSSPMNVQWLS